MTRLYTQNGLRGSVLDQRVERLVNVEDALNGREELALQRSTMQDRVEQYSAALEAGNSSHALAFGDMVNERAKDIVKTVETLGKHERARQEVMTLDMVRYYLQQMTVMALEMFGDTDKTKSFIAQIELMWTGGRSAEDIDSVEFLEMLGGTVPLVEEDRGESADIQDSPHTTH